MRPRSIGRPGRYARGLGPADRPRPGWTGPEAEADNRVSGAEGADEATVIEANGVGTEMII